GSPAGAREPSTTSSGVTPRPSAADRPRGRLLVLRSSGESSVTGSSSCSAGTCPTRRSCGSKEPMSRSAAGALRRVVPVAVLAAGQVAAESRSFAAPLGPSSLDIVSFTSTLLSQFWGAPTQMEAAVFVPASCRGAATPCPVMYHLPGYGGSIDTAWGTIAGFAHVSAHNRPFARAHVFLHPSVNGGYRSFTDSENNGPWNSALTQE